MLHVVPILCLIFFIFLVEFRFKETLNMLDKKVKQLEKNVPNYHTKEEIYAIIGMYHKDILDKKIQDTCNHLNEHNEDENMRSE